MNFIKFPLSADLAVSAPPLVTSPPVDRPTLPPPKRSISVLLKLMAVQPLKTGRIRSHMVIFMTKTTTFPPHFVHFLIKKFQRAEASFLGGTETTLFVDDPERGLRCNNQSYRPILLNSGRN